MSDEQAAVIYRRIASRSRRNNDFPPKGIPAIKWHLNNKNFCSKYFFPCICLSLQNIKTTMFESNNKATMMYFIDSFEYLVTFLVKIRPPEVDLLHSWAVVLGQIFRQIISIRVMTLINTNVVASRHIKREEVLLPVAVRRSKTPELKLNFICAMKTSRVSRYLNFLGETAFWRGIFCLEYPSRHSEKVNCHFANYRLSFRKLQIFISQITDFHFTNYRFSFRKLQIFILFRSTSFRFVCFTPFRFANYSKPQIWDFYGYSLNTLKYPKMGIRYFFLWLLVFGIYRLSALGNSSNLISLLSQTMTYSLP